MYGMRLRKLRKSKNMTQEEVAKKIGISKQAYSYYENQDRKPGLSRLIQLCEVFDVSMDMIIGDIDTGVIPIIKQRVNGNVTDSKNIIGYAAPPPLYTSSTDDFLYVMISSEDSKPYLDGYGLLKQNTKFQDGKIVGLQVENTVVFRRIKQDGDIMILIPLNDSYMPEIVDIDTFNDYLIGELIYSFKEYQ